MVMWRVCRPETGRRRGIVLHSALLTAAPVGELCGSLARRLAQFLKNRADLIKQFSFLSGQNGIIWFWFDLDVHDAEVSSQIDCKRSGFRNPLQGVAQQLLL